MRYQDVRRALLPQDQRNIFGWSDRASFAKLPANVGCFGYARPGQLIGPGTQTVSAKLAKRVPITERVALQMEGSFTNLLNHANFGIPALTINAANFGRITGTQGAEFGSGRTVQVGMRLSF